MKISSRFSKDFTEIDCSKVIGARYYNHFGGGGGYEATPRDFEGHGTHTASTAAGREVPASLYGVAGGVARGAVPSARLAVYKVCWSFGCFGADILAAFDDAIADGVDVISASLGSYSADDYFEDPIAIGAFHAMKKGILTSAAGGNAGPGRGTVSNVAPWMLVSAASSTDRHIIDKLILKNSNYIEVTDRSLCDCQLLRQDYKISSSALPFLFVRELPSTRLTRTRSSIQ